jgi:septum formation protein
LADKPLILASSSPFRRQLLERLALPFIVSSPQIDETPLPDESARQLVLRLAESKARALAGRFTSALIIGSDQVAVLQDQILGKPGNRANAIAQLTACNGKTVVFHTGLCLLDTAENTCQVDAIVSEVKFRDLTEAQIERYVDAEQPFNSAGSFKAESLGITLFEHLRGDDPSALIGLPLICLTRMLNNAGIALP